MSDLINNSTNKDLIEVRPMVFKDVKYVHFIEENCFTQPWPFEAFLMELDDKFAVNLVGVLNGEVVSYINAKAICGDVSITNVATNEKYRNKGVATSVMSHFINYCKQINAQILSLEVRVSNINAIRFYNRHGFITQGVRKNFYQQPTEDAMIMLLSLQ